MAQATTAQAPPAHAMNGAQPTTAPDAPKQLTLAERWQKATAALAPFEALEEKVSLYKQGLIAELKLTQKEYNFRKSQAAALVKAVNHEAGKLGA